MAVLAGSLVSLRAQVNAIAPGRSKTADGWIGDTAHFSRVSDHNPDQFGIVRAIDITDDAAGGLDALWLREALRRGRDPRIKYVISEGQMFSYYRTSTHPAWAWRPYVGVNAHMQHVHVSVVPGTAGDRAGSWSLSRDVAAPVRPPTTPATPAPVEDPDMTPDEFRTTFVTLMREAADRSTPTGRALGDAMAATVAPSAAALVWSAQFGSGTGRQTAAERLALASTGPDPAALAALLIPHLSADATTADVETALRNVLGSLNDVPKES